MIPSESSSGEKEHKGRITKTGNKRARRLLLGDSFELTIKLLHTHKMNLHSNARRLLLGDSFELTIKLLHTHKMNLHSNSLFFAKAL
ncbi:MAG: transposase [Planctomycetota bacterium]